MALAQATGIVLAELGVLRVEGALVLGALAGGLGFVRAGSRYERAALALLVALAAGALCLARQLDRAERHRPAEARRALRPGGKLFLYSHVMMSSRLAAFQRGVNKTVRWLDERGLVDNAPERERKSDHQNVLRSYEQLDEMLVRAGFRIADIRYYNVVLKAIFEDLMLPLVEYNFFGGAKKKEDREKAPHHDGDIHDGHGHDHVSTKPEVGRWAHAPLAVASQLMKLDVMLFGRVRTGPFFLLLEAV